MKKTLIFAFCLGVVSIGFFGRHKVMTKSPTEIGNEIVSASSPKTKVDIPVTQANINADLPTHFLKKSVEEFPSDVPQKAIKPLDYSTLSAALKGDIPPQIVALVDERKREEIQYDKFQAEHNRLNEAYTQSVLQGNPDANLEQKVNETWQDLRRSTEKIIELNTQISESFRTEFYARNGL